MATMYATTQKPVSGYPKDDEGCYKKNEAKLAEEWIKELGDEANTNAACSCADALEIQAKIKNNLDRIENLKKLYEAQSELSGDSQEKSTKEKSDSTEEKEKNEK